MPELNSTFFEHAVSRTERRVRKSLDYLQGNISLIRRTGLDAEQRGALRGIEQSTNEILLAIEQLRDLTHSSMTQSAQSFSFELERTLSWVHRQFRASMKSRGLEFSLAVDPAELMTITTPGTD